MFLRRHRKRVKGIDCDYWALCESVRTAAGPRQRIVAKLGKLDELEIDHDAGWSDVDDLLEGRRPARQLTLGKKAAGVAPCWEKADVANLRVERVRDFGSAWLGLSLWRRLGLGASGSGGIGVRGHRGQGGIGVEGHRGQGHRGQGHRGRGASGSDIHY